ncbi:MULTISPECIES: helix-turn-helix transcriptional regulator [unclassified Clostridium]|uniref:helix-turn-helix domain-containing protein n=1 Tax=unclassified Clostridium TaxID=2614128 RepID=UPI001105FBEA|nr:MULTISPECIES: helix-turn-helix transcriptional regulator [unclassified Clostridium]
MAIDEFIRVRIDELRRKRNISESKLSELIGYNRSYITQITNGSNMPTFAALEAICNFFEITPAQFFDPQYGGEASVEFYAKELARLEKEKDRAFIYHLLKEIDAETLAALRHLAHKIIQADE